MATKIPVRSTTPRTTSYDEYHEEEGRAPKGTSVAVVVAGIVAAASAIYLLGMGDRGQRNREKVKTWAMKAREEVNSRVQNLKEVSAEEYKEIVDTVMNHYKGIKNADLEEIGALGKELKAQWDDIKHKIQRPESRPEGRSNLRQYTDDEF